MHCDLHQPQYTYALNGCIMKSVFTLLDLGVTRSSNGGYTPATET